MMAFNTSNEEAVQQAVHPQRMQDVMPTAGVEESTSKETTVSAFEKKTRGYLKTFQRSFSSSAIERKITATEDPSVMTINFLRMRLQSQRADYRAEKQKAQKLAQKVLELEQRLNIEVELRNKAELGHMYSFAKHETVTSRHHESVPYNNKINYHNINSTEQQEGPHGCRSCFSSCNGCQNEDSVLQQRYPCQSLSSSCQPYRDDGPISKPFSPLESPHTGQSSHFSSDTDYCKEQRTQISPQQEIRFQQIYSPIRKKPNWLALPVDYQEAMNTKSEQHNPSKQHLISVEVMEEPSGQGHQGETSMLISKAEQSRELLGNRNGYMLDSEESEMSEPHPNLKPERNVKGKQIMQDWSTGKNILSGPNTCLLPHWKSNNFTDNSASKNIWKEEIRMDNPCNCLKNQISPQQGWGQREARSKSGHSSDGKAIGKDQAYELYRDIEGRLHSKNSQVQTQGNLVGTLSHSRYCKNHCHLKRASSDKFLQSGLQHIDKDYGSQALHCACSSSNGASIHNGIGIAPNPCQSLGQAYEAEEAKLVRKCSDIYQGPMYIPTAERNRGPSINAASLAKRAEPKHLSYHQPAAAAAVARKDSISDPIESGRRSLDGGLDKVRDIIKALKVARQRVEAADEEISIS